MCHTYLACCIFNLFESDNFKIVFLVSSRVHLSCNNVFLDLHEFMCALGFLLLLMYSLFQCEQTEYKELLKFPVFSDACCLHKCSLLLRITMTMTWFIKETIKLVHAYIQRFSLLLSWWHTGRQCWRNS